MSHVDCIKNIVNIINKSEVNVNTLKVSTDSCMVLTFERLKKIIVIYLIAVFIHFALLRFKLAISKHADFKHQIGYSQSTRNVNISSNLISLYNIYMLCFCDTL